MASVFTKIINGDLPCYKIHEDQYTLSFLSIEPIQLGHTLIVPKVEVDHFIDVPQEYAQAVFQNSLPISKAIHQATECQRVGTMIQGWEVPHFHYHIVPMYSPSDLSFSKAKKRSEKEMKEVQEKILEKLKLFFDR